MAEYEISPEYLNDLRTPAEQLEELFEVTKAEAIDILKRRFEDPSEAAVVIDNFIAKFQEKAEKIEEINKIQMRLSGEGVRLPDYEFQGAEDTDDNKQGIAILLPQADTMKPIEALDAVTGNFIGISGSVTNAEEEDSHKILLFALFDSDRVGAYPIHLGGLNLPILNVYLKPQALVSLDTSSEIVPAELYTLREKYELATTIAKEGLVNTLFMKQLRNLDRALFKEDGSKFTPLNKTSLFKRLGELGSIHSRRGQEQALLVSNAIVDVLGPDRNLEISYLEMFENTFQVEMSITGRVSFVVMPDSEDDSTKPSIVIEHKDGQKVIDFEDIRSLSY